MDLPVLVEHNDAHPAARNTYVIRGWPEGFCPLHVLEERTCGWSCLEVRLDFGDAARDLNNHWRFDEPIAAPVQRAA